MVKRQRRMISTKKTRREKFTRQVSSDCLFELNLVKEVCFLFKNRVSPNKIQLLPAYSAKQMVRGDFLIFSSNKSFLFKNRMMEVSVNHLLLQMESNSFKDSCIRFWNWKEKYLNQGKHETGV